jgi:hypothetical protein
MKIIVFEKLNFFTVWLCFFFSILRFRVYYYQPSAWFRDEVVVGLLAKAGIRIINFEEAEDLDVSITDMDSLGLASNAVETIFPTDDSLRFFGNLFPGIDDIERKLRVVLHGYFLAHSRNMAAMVSWTRGMVAPSKAIYFFADNDFIRSRMLRHLDVRCVNLCPAALSYFTIAVRFLFKAAGVAAKRLISPGKVAAAASNSSKIDGTPEGQIDYSKYEVLYFPHQSLFYGNLYLKDQYYDQDIDSPFHPTKILHVEISSKGLEQITYDRMMSYYREHNIPFDFWPKIDVRIYLLNIFKFYYFLIKNICSFLKMECPAKISAAHLFLIVYLIFSRHLAALSGFTNLKIVLVGFDLTFSKPLFLALESRKITSIATQERYIAPFWPHSTFAVNTYLSSSDYTGDALVQRRYTYVGRQIPVGLLRSDLILEYRESYTHEKYSKIKRDRKLVVAFDYYSFPDRFDNYRQAIVNWRANKAFYWDLVRLAVGYPEIFIVIRGKNDVWTRIPEFREVHEAIQMIPNIEADMEFKTNIAYKIASMADLIIAKHTSIANECQAAGLPVIYHDYQPNASKLFSSNGFDYDGYSGFAYSYEELNEKVFAFLRDGNIMGPGEYERLRLKLYGEYSDGRVGERIRSTIKEIYNGLTAGGIQ